MYPSILRVTAASGNIYYGRSAKSGSPGSTPVGGLLLAPSASGELSFLAQQSIYGGGTPVSMSGSDTPLPTPFMPAYAGYDLAGGLQRGSHNNSIEPVPRADGPVAPTKDAHPLFAFGTRRAPNPCARKERNRSASMRCRATWSA